MQLFEEVRAQVERWRVPAEEAIDYYDRAVLQALDMLGPDALWAIAVEGRATFDHLLEEAGLNPPG
jgi:hypothetical protein